jgi:hypothetical protein
MFRSLPLSLKHRYLSLQGILNHQTDFTHSNTAARVLSRFSGGFPAILGASQLVQSPPCRSNEEDSSIYKIR